MTNIKTFQVSIMGTNCYLIEDIATHSLALVDPGDFSKEIVDEIKRQNGTLDMILLTHGHFDHIGGVRKFLEVYPNAKVYIGEKDMVCIFDNNLNLSEQLFSSPLKPFKAVSLADNEEISLGETKIKFIETPGHTYGSGCYIFDDNIMSGDTLFQESCGRTDFPNSSSAQIIKSLRRLSEIPGDYNVYPGHMGKTTLFHERKYNPYLMSNYEDIY